MPGGVNFDEEKRRLQSIQMEAEMQIKKTQKLDYRGKKQVRDVKKLLMTIGIIVVLIVVLILLTQIGQH